jgi:hypothetical protein
MQHPVRRSTEWRRSLVACVPPAACGREIRPHRFGGVHASVRRDVMLNDRSGTDLDGDVMFDVHVGSQVRRAAIDRLAVRRHVVELARAGTRVAQSG